MHKRKFTQKVKKKKNLKVQFLVPVFKYFNPIKYIYFMDMIFPLDIVNSSEEDYTTGKRNMIKMVHIRPHIIFDKRKGFVSVTYDSPTIHILHNQCDYFLEYLDSLGDQEFKSLSNVLSGWKRLWGLKDISSINSKLDVHENYHFGEGKIDAEEVLRRHADGKVDSRNLKRLYYFERMVSYSSDTIKVNRFTLHFCFDLIERLQLKPDDFYNQILQYHHPIIICPEDTLKYRQNLLGQLLNGTHPRLGTNIFFNAPTKQIKIDPFLSVSRIYALKQNTIILRCSYSYLNEDEMKITDIQRRGGKIFKMTEDNARFLSKNIKKLIGK